MIVFSPNHTPPWKYLIGGILDELRKFKNLKTNIPRSIKSQNSSNRNSIWKRGRSVLLDSLTMYFQLNGPLVAVCLQFSGTRLISFSSLSRKRRSPFPIVFRQMFRGTKESGLRPFRHLRPSTIIHSMYSCVSTVSVVSA